MSLVGLPFIELQSVDSTNNYARQLITEGLAQSGMIVFAHEQLAGKGQRGHSWTTEKGSNIIMSLVLEDPQLPLADQFQLSAVISLAIHDFFSRYAGDATRIKWPNDLYWQDRKAGGVLIENVIGGGEQLAGLLAGSQKHEGIDNPINSWRWAIVGIGININQVSFPDAIKNPVSLKQITGKNFEVTNLAKELINLVQKRYEELIQNGFENILNLYNQHLYKKNETVRLKKGNVSFLGKIGGVTPGGRLLVTHSIQEEFGFGQIEWLLE